MAYKNKEERAAYARRYRLAHPERTRETAKRFYWRNVDRIRKKQREGSRKRLYGMPPEKYDELCVAQEHCCSICGKESKLYVDHDHETGRIRGLICATCNLLLGYAQDDFSLLGRAALYLAERKYAMEPETIEVL
jgi:hypothetical protein